MLARNVGSQGCFKHRRQLNHKISDPPGAPGLIDPISGRAGQPALPQVKTMHHPLPQVVLSGCGLFESVIIRHLLTNAADRVFKGGAY